MRGKYWRPWQTKTQWILVTNLNKQRDLESFLTQLRFTSRGCILPQLTPSRAHSQTIGS
jgi:hypothetical protein